MTDQEYIDKHNCLLRDVQTHPYFSRYLFLTPPAENTNDINNFWFGIWVHLPDSTSLHAPENKDVFYRICDMNDGDLPDSLMGDDHLGDDLEDRIPF